jgi:hypothetical protein
MNEDELQRILEQISSRIDGIQSEQHRIERTIAIGFREHFENQLNGLQERIERLERMVL